MISKDAQRENIRQDQNEKMPLGIRVAKRGLQGLAVIVVGTATVKFGADTATYLNEVMGAPPELTNVVDIRRGDVAAGGLYGGSLGAAWCMIEYGARKIYGKLRGGKE